jgi:hypothetical protein
MTIFVTYGADVEVFARFIVALVTCPRVVQAAEFSLIIPI